MQKLRAGLRRLLRGTGIPAGDGQVRATDIFIAGHPKSGMTWMQFLLIHALLEKREGDVVTFKNQSTYVPDLSGRGTDQPLPLAQFADRPAPRVFFTHTPCDTRLLRGKVVYMLRDPRDVLVSYYHHHVRTVQGFDESLSQFIRRETFSPCVWDAHVRGWLNTPADPEHLQVVRYEHLRQDPVAQLTRVLRFCATPFTAADVERAVRMSEFKRMRRIEEQYGRMRPVYNPTTTFVRKGVAGGWRTELTPDDIAYIQTRFADMMRSVGYAAVDPAHAHAPAEAQLQEQP